MPSVPKPLCCSPRVNLVYSNIVEIICLDIFLRFGLKVEFAVLQLKLAVKLLCNLIANGLHFIAADIHHGCLPSLLHYLREQSRLFCQWTSIEAFLQLCRLTVERLGIPQGGGGWNRLTISRASYAMLQWTWWVIQSLRHLAWPVLPAVSSSFFHFGCWWRCFDQCCYALS